MKIKFLVPGCVASAALLAAASTASAGGFVAPVVETTTVAVAPVGAWQGAYAGGSLGYSFGSDDEIGFNAAEEDGAGIGAVDIKGLTAGAHVGYRWQRDRWIFGPELGIEGGSVDASDTVSFEGGEFDVESSVNYIVTLVLKTAYAVDPQTLVYGTFGAARGDFDYSRSAGGSTETVSYSDTGLAAGLGVERLVSASTSVFAEYQYRDFGRTQVTFTEGGEATTVATPKHSNIKVGVNFRF